VVRDNPHTRTSLTHGFGIGEEDQSDVNPSPGEPMIDKEAR
jgi:hypothetical protein